MVSVDAEAGEAIPRPQPTVPAASSAAAQAAGPGGPGEVVVLKAHYGSTAVPLAAHQVVRRNSPLGGLVKSTPKLSVASKAGQPGEDAAGGAEGEPRRPARVSVGPGSSAGSRGPSVFDHVERYVQPRWKTHVAKVMDGVPYTLASILITLMVLYSDNLRVAVAPPSADDGFLGFTIFCLVFFGLEVLAASITKPKYFLRFYFFIDVVATFTLLFDIPAFMDAITGTSGGDDSAAHSTVATTTSSTQSNARAARIAQVVRVIRLIRIVKLYKVYAQNRHRLAARGGLAALEEATDEGAPAASRQTRVGEKLTELTIRKVILGVLILLFVLPVFDVNGYYGQAPTLESGGLTMLHTMYGAGGGTVAFQDAVDRYIEDNSYRLGTRRTAHLLRLTVYNQTLFNSTGGGPRLRADEVTSARAQTPGCGGGLPTQCFYSVAAFDTRWKNQLEAILAMSNTTFIIAILLVGSLLFIRDADRLVLKPLERMVKKVKDVSENPLARQEVVPEDAKDSGKKQQMETRILENAIGKICSLLSVGFGEAGAEVIADNIKSGGDLNPMVPGRRVMAVFGFCDIRQFTDTTEVLQEGVMEFVNSIARIVHQEVALHGGAANKNIGDAFLLVWKLPVQPPRPRTGASKSGGGLAASKDSVALELFGPAGEAFLDLPAGRGRGGDGGGEGEEASSIADAALASFIIIQAALKRSKKLQGYCTRPDLNARMPGFQIKMGFGLHVGWAIEGAIGSEYKIDASYLSPHVNMASRLEAATKQYGVTVLLSDAFVAMLSPPVAARIRQVDCVTVKGSQQPVGLYTYDISTDGLDVWTDLAKKTAKTPLGSPSTAPSLAAPPGSPPRAGERGGQYESFSLRPYLDEYEEHPDIVMTSAAEPDFLARFREGYEAYRTGDWATAKAVLEECRGARRNRHGDVIVDGPSSTLLSVMSEHGYLAPVDWPGFRELTEK